MGTQTTPPRAAAGYALEVESAVGTLAGQPVGGFGTLRIQGDPPAGDIETGRLALRDLRIEPSPPLEEWLRRFGYPALLADLTAESRYDRARGRLELGSLSLAGREMGVLGLSLALEGVTPEVAEAQDWEQLKLAGLALRFLDQSLLGRAARDAARQGRTTEAQVREGWAGQVAATLGAGRRADRGPEPRFGGRHRPRGGGTAALPARRGQGGGDHRPAAAAGGAGRAAGGADRRGGGGAAGARAWGGRALAAAAPRRVGRGASGTGSPRRR